MVDGETYECVKRFCYLEDTLDGDGGADLAATARIKNGWMKVREPFLTSRVPHHPSRTSIKSDQVFLVLSQSCVSTLTP